MRPWPPTVIILCQKVANPPPRAEALRRAAKADRVVAEAQAVESPLRQRTHLRRLRKIWWTFIHYIEFKTDLDNEPPRSGKPATNALALFMAALACNILWFIGPLQLPGDRAAAQRPAKRQCTLLPVQEGSDED